MPSVGQILKCESCGAMVELVHECTCEPCTMTCCDQPMKMLNENTVDAAKEKHVPVVEQTDKGVKVKVGSVAHPMEEDHYIEWIEVISGGKIYRQHLKPGQAPEAEFAVAGGDVTAREYCNKHGLWKK